MSVKVLDELIFQQKRKLLDLAQTIVPQITAEDILQPQDYPELDNNLAFRFEEGLLYGLEVAMSAIRAEKGSPK